MLTTVRDIEPICQYLEEQFSKGLIDGIRHYIVSYAGKRHRVGFWTHWGTYQEVIKPEIMRITVQNKWRLQRWHTRRNIGDRWYEECDVVLGDVGTYVEVGLYVDALL